MTEASVRQLRIFLAAGTIAVTAVFGAPAVIAQSGKQAPARFTPLTQQREEPIRITSETLEVVDKQKLATFSGDVHVIQGDNDLRCAVLVVFYDQDEAGKGKPKAKATKTKGEKSKSEGSNQQIRRMEARGSVVLTQKDQRAVGDRADYDVQTNTLVLLGNVVVTRGEDVLRGHRMVVDMATGVSRIESGGGRVEGMFKSSPGQQQRPGRPNRVP